MKKRMFLSTILMTLVLLVAVTTATFAWYKVTAINTYDADIEKSVSTIANDYNAGGLTISLAWANPTAVAMSEDSTGTVKYWVGDQLITDTGTRTTKASVVLTVTASMDGASSDVTLEDLLDAAGGSFVVTVTSDARLRIQKQESDVYTDNDELTFELTTADLQDGEGVELTLWYSVDGEGATNNIDNDALSLSLSATVTEAAAE